MINDASVVIGGGNWGIKEADVLGYKLINDEYYAREIDFANSTAAGTYTDSTGVVRKAPYNLLQYSEMFTDASWAKTTTTVTANTITAPNGTLTANTLTASGSFPRVVQNPTIQANQSYRISTYAKAGSASVFKISVTINGVTLINEQYNLSTGVVTGSGTMQDVGNGWYLCSATFTVGASTASPDIRFYNHAQGVTDGWSGTNFFYAWGAQLVEGTEALPYFPTTTRLNVPRIDYRNADGSLSTTGRLLLEPQRTNLFLYSEQLENSYWIKVGVGTGLAPVVNENYAISPSGLQNADRVYFDAVGTTSSDRSGLVRDFAFTSGQTYTISAYVKSATGTNQILQFRVAGAQVGGELTATNEWQRFSVTHTATTTATDNFGIQLRGNNTTNEADLLLYGLQLEQASYATTYIPTTTAAVTRNADAASRTGVSSWIGQTEGTLFLDITTSDDITTALPISISDGSVLNRILIFVGSGVITARVSVGSVTQAEIVSSSISANTRYKMAIAYKENDFAFYINGVQIGTDTSGSVPACSKFSYDNGSGTAPFYGLNQQSIIFPTRLTNSQLQSLTTL